MDADKLLIQILMEAKGMSFDLAERLVQQSKAKYRMLSNYRCAWKERLPKVHMQVYKKPKR